MELHFSLTQYITTPKDYHLQMEGGVLKATKSTTSHEITSLNLDELKTLATTDGLAKKVLAALRTNESQTEFSVSALLRPILPERIFIGVFGTIPSDMEENLNNWCEEEIGTPEYEDRALARTKIRECFLNKLQRLDLNNTFLTTLPESIGDLSNLTSLILSNNPLTALPESIGRLTSLTEFDLRDTLINALPESIGDLSNLTNLILSDTPLTALPESIGRLTSLTEFDLKNTSLTALPESIGGLTSLTNLSLSCAPIVTLPESIGRLTTLRSLFLRSTSIVALPESIGSLTSLTNLDLTNAPIVTLPESIGNLSSLMWLYLNRSQIVALPESIGRLTTLRGLCLNGASILTLPQSIGGLTSLTTLHLDGTLITALPESIGRLTSLTNLCLENTRITTLPESIGNLSSLTTLGLTRTLITSLPANLARLSSSCRINADDTRLSAPVIAAFQEHLRVTRITHPELGPHFEFSIYDVPSIRDARAVSFIRDARAVSLETSLETKFTFWLTEFKKAFPPVTYGKLWEIRTESHYPGIAAAGAGARAGEDPYLSFYKELLEHPQKELLNIFLRRLQDTEDFNGAAKSTLILQVEQMLTLAAVNKDFRDKVFLILEDAFSTCGDRVTNALTEIEIQYRLYSTGDNPLNLASLLIGIARKDLLHGIAVKKIEELRLGDAIETILYYKLQLKDVLKLPITTEGMLYPCMSGIKAEDLVAAKDEVLAKTTSLDDIVKLLLQFDPWKERIKTLCKEELERFQATFMERLAAIPSTLSEGEQLDANTALTKEYNTSVASFIESRTNDWVSANLRDLLGL